MPVEYSDLDSLKNQHNDIRFEQMQQTADIRRDTAADTAEIIKESLKGDHEVFAAVRDNRYDLSSRIENAADRSERGISALADRFFTVARDTADLRAQVIQAIDTTKMAGEMAALKSQIEMGKTATYLSDKIGNDGDRTRALINDLKYNDLNRSLIERNAELVDERYGRRHWRHLADQGQFGGQFAALQSQMQNFGSQLQDVKQGTINFGTMSGNAGRNTSTNNVV